MKSNKTTQKKNPEWRRVFLKDIVKCTSGTSFPPAIQGKATGSIPFYKVSDMNESCNNLVMNRANNYINHNDLLTLRAVTHPLGSVIFPKVGGALFTNKKRILSKPSLVDNNIMVVTVLDNFTCIPEFIYLFFETVDLRNLSNPGPLPSINAARVYELDLWLPSILEQKSIAFILIKIRQAIEIQKSIIEKTRELKKSILHHVFTHGLRGEKLKETAIDPIPESWDVCELGSVLTLAQYGLSVRGLLKGQYPILRMNCQIDGQVHLNDLQYVNLDSETFEKFKIDDGDILFNRTNSWELVGRTAIYHSKEVAVFASYLIRLKLDEPKINPDYLNDFFNMDATQKRLKSLASRGVSQSNISASKLKTFQIPIPELNEQLEIVKIIHSVNQKIEIHTAKKSGLQDLFKTMLNKLMTGEIRVKDLDIDVSEVSA